MALLIAGTNSGCGKSTVSLGIMAAMVKLGLAVQPFKAGPDFIDPGLHRMVTNKVSRNLDLWMCGERFVKDSLRRHSLNAGAAVIEGVMGYYDGGERSTAVLASTLGAKVVLVLDASGMAESAGAILSGFKNYGGRVDGVIFNRVGSRRHYERLKTSAGGVEPLGFLPRDVGFTIPERHLGLLVAEEEPLPAESIARLSEAVIENINIDRLVEWARPDKAEDAATLPSAVPGATPDNKVTIAVAHDRAFCFYYEDNLEMLGRAGAEIVFFSPLAGGSLPVGADAIYLPGGYPEMMARELEENEPMRTAIKEFSAAGRPIYAECGGMMYLGEGIIKDGVRYEMCGALPIVTELKSRLCSLGYREPSINEHCLLGPAGARLRGHEFHYSEVVDFKERAGVRYNVLGEAQDNAKVSSVISGSGGTLASYTHLHFGATPEVPAHMVRYISETKNTARR